ncbi:hypothetical protein [Streptomyces spinosirectus]
MSDIMTLRDPAYRAPTDDEVLQLEDDVTHAAHALAHAISERETAYRAGGQEVPDGVAASPDWQLTYLYALHAVDGIVRRLADRTARTAGAIGVNYGQLGAAWGITKQAARLRWPGAVRKPTEPTDETEPLQLHIAGGAAEIVQLPDARGFTWAATGADGTTSQAEQSYANRTEAAAHAGAFLALHTEPDEDNYDQAQL